MHIGLDNPNHTALKTLAITHKGDKTLWDVSEYIRLNKKFHTGPNELFTEINAYFDHCTEQAQDRLYAILHQIHQDLRQIEDPYRLFRAVKDQVTAFYDVLKFDDLYYWCTQRANLPMPTDIRTQLSDTDKPEQTYLRDDYYDLMVLAIALRPMVAVFGEFIPRANVHSGTGWKIHRTLRILGDSELVHTRPFLRLQRYVEFTIPRNSRGHVIDNAAIAGGLSSDELPEWLLAMVVVKRLCVGTLVSADGKEASLIKRAYHAIDMQHQHMYRPFGGPISPKITGSNGGNREDDFSFAESYRLNKLISEGALQNNTTYIQLVTEPGLRVDHTLDVERCWVCVYHLHNQRPEIRRYQTILTQWVMASAVSPRAIVNVDYADQLNMLGVTQALLWHWEFYTLAALCSAQPMTLEGYDIRYNVGQRLSKSVTETLNEMYPYAQRLNTKRKKIANVAIHAIQEMVDTHLDTEMWVFPPEELIPHLPDRNFEGIMTLPSDIRLQLAELLFKLNTLDQ